MASSSSRRRSSTPRTSEQAAQVADALGRPSGPLAQVHERRLANERWTLTATVVISTIVGLVGAVIAVAAGASIIVGVAVLIIFGLGSAAAVLRGAPARAVRAVGGEPAPKGAVPRVDALLDSLCALFGVGVPDLSVIDDDVRNACIVKGRSKTTIVVTTGLLTALSVVQLEGVLAHLVARERLAAVGRATTGAGLALALGPIGRRPGVAHRLIGTGGLFVADEIAAVTVRYPTGLAEALELMADGPLPEPGSLFSRARFDALRWLFVDPSIARRTPLDGFDDLDATSVRTATLLEW